MGAAYSVLGALALFGGLGYYIDSRWTDNHLGLLSGLFLGVLVGLYELGKFMFRKP